MAKVVDRAPRDDQMLGESAFAPIRASQSPFAASPLTSRTLRSQRLPAAPLVE
jgi:hypothetical protein